MGLMALLEKTLNSPTATATTATTATHYEGVTVATVATVAVATEPILKTERPYLRLVRAGAPPTESELQTIEQRQQLFESKGFTVDESESLAHGLLLRDRDIGDNRRACAECGNWYGGRCKVRLYPCGDSDIYTLHRCDGFESGSNCNL
jgi:hypothetical protein